MHNKKDTHYDPVQDYSMKCRLYPTKMQAKAIDDALMGIRIFHNCLIYDIFNNGMHQIERIKTLKDGSKTDEKVHFIDLKSAMKAEYKANLIADHPIIEACPQGAITTNIGLKADLKREFGGNPIEYQKPKYYNDLHPRFSYTYQETAGKIKETTNQKVFMINLAKIGSVKVRGWNRKLRFDDENTDFLKWAVSNQKTKITVIVSKDEVGDYFIVFKIPKCLKPFPVATSVVLELMLG